MFQLPNVRFHGIDPSFLQGNLSRFQSTLKADRGRKRLLDLLQKHAVPPTPSIPSNDREWYLDFLRSPKQFLPSTTDQTRLGGIEFEINRLEGDAASSQAIGTGQMEIMPASITFRSIGYQSIPVPGLPFDDRRGIVPNNLGRVLDLPPYVEPHSVSTPSTLQRAEEIPSVGVPVATGLYVAGWLKRGPMGVITTTMYDAFQTAETILSDIHGERYMHPPSSHIGGNTSLPSSTDNLTWLRSKGVRVVTFQDWKRVEREEERLGEVMGKVREKFTKVEDILKVLDTLDSRNK
jgi:adrenodoxin-NADP+ reductase